MFFFKSDRALLFDIYEMMNKCRKEVKSMSVQLDALKTQIEKTVQIEAAAVQVIVDLTNQLKAAVAANDTAALEELTQKLASSSDALSVLITPVTNPEA